MSVYNVSALPFKKTHLLQKTTVWLALSVWLFPALLWAQNDPLIRINSGSSTEVTDLGITFVGDTYASESSVGPESNASIAGTTNDEIYQSERISNASLDPFGYAIPVSNGTYAIRLHFAETAFQEDGRRVFDVQAEGVTILNDYDIHDEAGAINTATFEDINVNVLDGELNIDFIAVVERAKISAIEVFGSVPSVSIPFGVNAGGSTYSSGSFTWMEDEGTYFLDGMTFSNTIDIDGTQDDVIYQAERFNKDLRFLLPGFERGLYTIDLHFAETNHTSSGERVFDVDIEGETVLNNYDIFAEAGGNNTAIVETFEDVLVADGILNITLQASVASSTINAIAITGATSVSNEEELIERPDVFHLSAAYPNPFNPQTQFSLSVGSTQRVAINVYNVLGQQVATVFRGTMPAQQNRTFLFEAGSLPSGIYLIQARGENFTETMQVVLMK